ncbi:MAG: SLC13 family permease [Lachnospiraceae bacterium]
MEAQKEFGKKIAGFLKKEVVLCIAALLAILSMFLIPPDAGYKTYIDYRVLAILFSLMTVMAGLRQIGVFDKIAHVMLKKADDFRKLSFIMVFLCFFSAMFITNDVALLTFVPFTLLLLSMAGLKEQAIPLVVYETVAANLGSMLTPVGNPQNLYLYTASGMEILDFLKITAPIVGISALLLAVCCMGSRRLPVSIHTDCASTDEWNGRNKAELAFFCIVFGLSLLTVLKVIPVQIPFLAALLGTLIVHRKVLLKVDYCLLLTFVSFFVFTGNMGRIEAFSTWLRQIMAGRELLISFFTSQIISNVPAAALLSGFTGNYPALIEGTNIGGLGTLIASLASLISYKAFVQEYPEKKGKYFWYFTLVNVIFAVILLIFTACFL